MAISLTMARNSTTERKRKQAFDKQLIFCIYFGWKEMEMRTYDKS